MTPFLQQIAQRYYADYADKMQSVAFVFPNRRAGLFFRQALARVANRPLFAPDIYAINDLFFRESDLLQADRVTLQFALYDTYRRITGRDEPFDRFCFLGEMLLADFDDIDKYMADARQVFGNIGDLKELESNIDWLDDEKREIISRFWQVFLTDNDKEFKRQFSEVWSHLFDVYTNFKADLRRRGVGYDGMIFRDVAESDTDLQLDYERVVFVGFNALTATEMALFEKCRRKGIGDFYFDYQSPEIAANDNIAAQFMEENRRFKSHYELEAHTVPTDREIELIAIPSDIGQTKQVYRILEQLQNENPDSSNLHTVVVLPNEQLLIPQLHAIPESIATVNVTMGYPLSLTPVAALVAHIATAQRNRRLVAAQPHFYYKNVLAVVNHPLVAANCPAVPELVERIHKSNLFLVPTDEFAGDELLECIFRPVDSVQDLAGYFLDIIDRLAQLAGSDRIETEFFVQYKAAINRVTDNLREFNMTIEPDTFFRLLSQLTAGQTVSFKGEPVEGLQLMGTLETRALDFENVIITSFNEGVFPRKSNSPSLIPYNLRRAFGLPTHEYHDAIFAYNFYRLIYRARRVFLIYDSRTDGQHGELSRYASQLEYLYNLPLRKKAVGYEVSVDAKNDFEVAKTDKVADRLRAFYSDDDTKKYISASDINCYIDCPMRFYYSKVEGLNAPDDVSETVEANMFGSIFHKVMELIYSPYKGKTITKEAVQQIIDSKSALDRYIDLAFTEVFYKNRSNMPRLGQNLLIEHVIRTYVVKTLEFDRDVRSPFVQRCSEERITISFPIDNGLKINLKGIIDRVDEQNDLLYIVDYKTGTVEKHFKQMDDLFDSGTKNRPKAVLQTFFYALLYTAMYPQILKLKPIIYELRNLEQYEITCGAAKEPVQNYATVAGEFGEKLKVCLSEIFDPTIPFRCTNDTDKCAYCDFKQICNR